jgi:hypothetical protein
MTWAGRRARRSTPCGSWGAAGCGRPVPAQRRITIPLTRSPARTLNRPRDMRTSVRVRTHRPNSLPVANFHGPSGCGETGIHAAFRSPCPYGRGGSNPLSRTDSLMHSRAEADAGPGTRGERSVGDRGGEGTRSTTIDHSGLASRSAPTKRRAAPAGCGADHVLDELPPEYVYLLGLYLGDGAISSHPRASPDCGSSLTPSIRGSSRTLPRRSEPPRERQSGTVTRGNCVEVYSFSNHSADIHAIFRAACDRLEVRWTGAKPHTTYVSRKADVARLDDFIGPKRRRAPTASRAPRPPARPPPCYARRASA